MKLTAILSTCAVFTGALANTALPSAHAIADLLARDMDPSTMDPTKLSVLSVLRTVMPSSTSTGTEIVLPTGDIVPQWYSDLPADVMVLLAQMYPATPTAAASANESLSSAQGDESVGQSTLTRSLELFPTATAAGNGSLATGVESGKPANASATFSSVDPSATQSVLSTGAKNAGSMGRWSIVMGAGVAAVFCFFA